MKRPIGVALISAFYLFGAAVLLFTSIFYDADANQIDIGARFGLSRVPEQPMRAMVAIVSVCLAVGYMRLRKWGFWLMIAYSVLVGAISFSLSLWHPQQPFTGNMLWSMLVLAYTIYAKRAFFQKTGV